MPAIEPLIRLLFDPPSYRSGVRTLTTCQFPLPGGELVSICPTHAHFPAQPLCPKFQMRVQYVAPGLVQHGLCGGFAPHESLNVGRLRHRSEVMNMLHHIARIIKYCSLCVLVLGILDSASPIVSQPISGTTSVASTPIGTWQCWNDGSPDPCHNWLLSISISSPSNGWIAGEYGTLLHWDGSAWSRMYLPSTAIGITTISANDAWAVGESGRIFHWDGCGWESVSSPTTTALRSIAMVSTTNGWAAGDGGVLIYWDGNAWSAFPNPATSLPNPYIFSVVMASPTTGWALGSHCDLDCLPLVLQWNGNAWAFASGTTATLAVINIISEHDGWALDRSGQTWHWDGNAWLLASSRPVGGITALDMVSDVDGWAVNGVGAIYHWNGYVWTQVTEPVTDLYSNFYRIAMISSTDGWAIGFDGTMLRWNGQIWTAVVVRNIYAFTGITMASKTDGWAMSGKLWHWDGQTWKSVPSPGDVFQAIAILSPTDAWAVGYSYWHWDGVTWEIKGPTDFTDSDLKLGVAMASSTDGWAVGGGAPYEEPVGKICHWNGNTWSTMTNTFSSTLRSVAMVSSTDGWAVGDNGIILHWNGNDWSNVTGPVSYTLRSVRMASVNDGWAVGNGGILQWDGSNWTEIYSGAMPESVAVNSSDDAWGVGFGTISHWDGNSWTAVNGPRGFYILTGVSMISPEEGWAVGGYGTILYYSSIPSNYSYKTFLPLISQMACIRQKPPNQSLEPTH
jgi:hypothetical protein